MRVSRRSRDSSADDSPKLCIAAIQQKPERSLDMFQVNLDGEIAHASDVSHLVHLSAERDSDSTPASFSSTRHAQVCMARTNL